MLIEMSKLSKTRKDMETFINTDAIAYIEPALGSEYKDTVIRLTNDGQVYIKNRTPHQVVETLREFGVNTSHL